ncbi:YbiU family protein, partial [Neisseria dentiae]
MAHMEMPADVGATIKATKQQLKAALPDYKRVFDEVEADIRAQVEEIKAIRASGGNPIPQLQADDIVNGNITAEQIGNIRKRGCVIVHGVFDR